MSYRWQSHLRRGAIDHDAAWGRSYAKVYSAVLFEIIPKIHKEERAARRTKRKEGRK